MISLGVKDTADFPAAGFGETVATRESCDNEAYGSGT